MNNKPHVINPPARCVISSGDKIHTLPSREIENYLYHAIYKLTDIIYDQYFFYGDPVRHTIHHEIIQWLFDNYETSKANGCPLDFGRFAITRCDVLVAMAKDPGFKKHETFEIDASAIEQIAAASGWAGSGGGG